MYSWSCTGNNCPDVAIITVTSQSGSTVSGFLQLCVESGQCGEMCVGGSTSPETTFSGTVSGNCIDVTSTDGTWSGRGTANGNNMEFTITSTAQNCFGARSQTVTLGH